MKVKFKTLDNYRKDEDHETINLYCGHCGHRWEGSSMYEGLCPSCGILISKPGSGHEFSYGDACGKCKHHRHYPVNCEIYGDNHPDSQTKPDWGISAVNCPDYEKTSYAKGRD